MSTIKLRPSSKLTMVFPFSEKETFLILGSYHLINNAEQSLDNLIKAVAPKRPNAPPNFKKTVYPFLVASIS